MDWLRFILFPGSGTTDGASTLSFEGIDPGWALIGWVVLAVALWWIHGRLLPTVTFGKRVSIVGLRLLFAAVLLFVATRPVLVTTLVENVRQKLLVLIDDSASMDIADLRVSNEDRARALIATGKLAPDAQLTEPVTAKLDPAPTRRQLLAALSENTKLDLWTRLDERAELVFHRFDTDASEGVVARDDVAAANFARAFVGDLAASGQSTALGESLRQVLDRHRGQPVAGVLAITDGASNRGLAPAEAASIARADGVPLFLYGVGVTEPRDIKLVSADAPRLAFVEEQVNVRILVGGAGYAGQTTRVQLRRPGVAEPLAEEEITLPKAGTVERTLTFNPTDTGELVLEAAVLPLAGEASEANNVTTSRIRVVDNRVKVFMIEQEPRWDWRYLIDFIANDRRLALKCLLLDGSPRLLTIPDTPFVAELPSDRAALYENDVMLIGDVDPERLGRDRMQIIRDWVDQAGGGLVFLAGPKFNPAAYRGTPLEPLLPVVPGDFTPEQMAPRHDKPVKLRLTPAGERAPLLRLAEEPKENAAIWQNFEGVRWTAKVARARPGAEVLLVDPTPGTGVPRGGIPVIARQRYGRGEVIYIGTNETYRWRSGIGGKYYSQIWAQAFQALSLERLSGASKQVQLRVDNPEYDLGDRVVISGRLYQTDFKPFVADVVPARLEFTPEGATEPIRQDLPLRPVPDEAGGYRVEFTPAVAGQYRFLTPIDPTAAVEFEVIAPQLEQADAAMNLGLLDAMAQAADGRLLREEDLAGLPELIASSGGKITSLKRLELAYSPVLLGLLILFACAEWLVRRLNRLK
ncbi:MAG: hypothetical protein ABII82_10120 [Verrucomicrobiota bacterium]